MYYYDTALCINSNRYLIFGCSIWHLSQVASHLLCLTVSWAHNHLAIAITLYSDTILLELEWLLCLRVLCHLLICGPCEHFWTQGSIMPQGFPSDCQRVRWCNLGGQFICKTWINGLEEAFTQIPILFMDILRHSFYPLAQSMYHVAKQLHWPNYPAVSLQD